MLDSADSWFYTKDQTKESWPSIIKGLARIDWIQVFHVHLLTHRLNENKWETNLVATSTIFSFCFPMHQIFRWQAPNPPIEEAVVALRPIRNRPCFT
jgi:hypothetical protein